MSVGRHCREQECNYAHYEKTDDCVPEIVHDTEKEEQEYGHQCNCDPDNNYLHRYVFLRPYGLCLFRAFLSAEFSGSKTYSRLYHPE